MCAERKPLVWFHGEIKTPPFSAEARFEAGVLLGRLQEGDLLGLPHSRPMPSIGLRCHELRVRDADRTWRIVYQVHRDAIVIVEVFDKTTKTTPKHIIQTCKQRITLYGAAVRKAAKKGGA
jgi:phage-related protein